MVEVLRLDLWMHETGLDPETVQPSIRLFGEPENSVPPR